MCSVAGRSTFQAVLVALGITIAAYAYYVETSKEHDSSFKAYCDINEHVSCSKVFTSRWGRGMGLVEYVTGKDSILNQPNSVYGILYYVILLIIDGFMVLPVAKLQVLLCVVANLSSVWLAYILFVVLQDVCVVCISMYIVNFLLLVSSILKYQMCNKLKQS